MDQDDGIGQQDHGGEEVHHDQIRVEFRVDHDPPQHRLGQNPDDQAAAQVDQVAPAGAAKDGGQEGGGHDDGQDHGDQAVPELDQPVELEGRGEVADRALGPVAASEARPGQADGAAGDHDEGDQGQGQHVEAMAEGGGDGEGAASRHSALIVPGPPAWSGTGTWS